MRCLFKNSRGEIATILTLISVGLMMAGVITGSIITSRETRVQTRAENSPSCRQNEICLSSNIACIPPMEKTDRTCIKFENNQSKLGKCCILPSPTNTPTPTPTSPPICPTGFTCVNSTSYCSTQTNGSCYIYGVCCKHTPTPTSGIRPSPTPPPCPSGQICTNSCQGTNTGQRCNWSTGMGPQYGYCCIPLNTPTSSPQGPGGGCANITEVKTNPEQIKRNEQFKCLVTTSNAAGSSWIACGLSINGGWPLNICPSDTMFEGWSGAIAKFGCRKLDDFSSQIPAGATLEMVGFDFSSGCGPQTGKRIPFHVTGEPTQTPVPTQPACDPDCCGKPDSYLYSHGLKEECDTNIGRWVIIEGVCQGQKRSQKRGCATCDNCSSSDPQTRPLQPNSLSRNACNSNCPLPTPQNPPTATIPPTTPTIPLASPTLIPPTPTGCPAPKPIEGQLPNCNDPQNQDNCADCVIRNRNDVYQIYFVGNADWNINSCQSRKDAINNWCTQLSPEDCNQAKQCHCYTECFGATPTPTPAPSVGQTDTVITKLVLDLIPIYYDKNGDLTLITPDKYPIAKIAYKFALGSIDPSTVRYSNNIDLSSTIPTQSNDRAKFEITGNLPHLLINNDYFDQEAKNTGIPVWPILKIILDNLDYCLKGNQWQYFVPQYSNGSWGEEMTFKNWSSPDRWILCEENDKNVFTLSGSSNETIQKAIDDYVNGRISAIQMSFFIAQLTRTPGLQLQYCNPEESDPNKGGCNFPE